MMHPAYINLPPSVYSSGLAYLLPILAAFLGAILWSAKQIHGYLKRRLKPIPVEIINERRQRRR